MDVIRKISMTLLMLGGVACVNAAEAREGAYLGVAAGMESSSLELKDDFSGVSVQLSVTGAAGGVFAGYGWKGISGYFAVEADLGVSGADNTTRLGPDRVTLEASQYYGASMLLGTYVSRDNALFLRLGWAAAKYEACAGGFCDKETLDGFRAGVGAQMPLRENLDVRLEWSRTFLDDSDLDLDLDRDLFQVGLAVRF